MRSLFFLAVSALISCAPSNQENNSSIDNENKDMTIDAVMEDTRGTCKYLIFEFPDGVRGGFGRIWGELDVSSGLGEDLTQTLEKCGAVNPRFLSVWSHSNHVVTQSTTRDRAVVQCFIRATSTHFNVGIGTDPSLQNSKIDNSRFGDLENNPDRKRLR